MNTILEPLKDQQIQAMIATAVVVFGLNIALHLNQLGKKWTAQIAQPILIIAITLQTHGSLDRIEYFLAPAYCIVGTMFFRFLHITVIPWLFRTKIAEPDIKDLFDFEEVSHEGL